MIALVKSNLFEKVGVAYTDKFHVVFTKFFNLKNIYKNFISQLEVDKYDTVFHVTLEIKGLVKVKLENEFKGEKIFATDGLMIEAGADPRIEIPKKLNIKLDSQTNEIIVDKDQKTNIEGIYAAGDITNSSNLKQTITAASQGAIAALSSYNFLMETS